MAYVDVEITASHLAVCFDSGSWIAGLTGLTYSSHARYGKHSGLSGGVSEPTKRSTFLERGDCFLLLLTTRDGARLSSPVRHV